MLCLEELMMHDALCHFKDLLWQQSYSKGLGNLLTLYLLPGKSQHKARAIQCPLRCGKLVSLMITTPLSGGCAGMQLELSWPPLGMMDVCASGKVSDQQFILMFGSSDSNTHFDLVSIFINVYVYYYLQYFFFFYPWIDIYTTFITSSTPHNNWLQHIFSISSNIYVLFCYCFFYFITAL